MNKPYRKLRGRNNQDLVEIENKYDMKFPTRTNRDRKAPIPALIEYLMETEADKRKKKLHNAFLYSNVNAMTSEEREAYENIVNAWKQKK